MSNIPWRRPNFTRTYLRSILIYELDTGLWLHRFTRQYNAIEGHVAGCMNKSDGRWYLTVKSKRYSSSRLAWFYMKGTWPKRDVEHEDGNRTNNRWKNLRLATRTQNGANAKPRVPFKGVTRVRTGKYTAQIQKSKQKIHLGTFDTPEEAHVAYAAKAKQLYGTFARTA
jgi:hypothetical protein